MALAFSSPLAPTELEDPTTRPSRPQLHLAPSNSLGYDFTWPRATRSATTSLGPEQLARPQLHLAPSNSLGHNFTWPWATRFAIAQPQQLARPRAHSTTLPIYFSRPRATRLAFDFISHKLTPTQQRHRTFSRELLAISNSTSLAHRVSSASIASSLCTWTTVPCNWTSLEPLLPPLQVLTI